MEGLYREEKYNVVKFPEFKDIVKKKLWKNNYYSLIEKTLTNSEKRWRLTRVTHIEN